MTDTPLASRDVGRVLLGAWSLFTALLLVMLGNGLLGTLIGVRAEIEAFSTTAIGLVMSGYFIGFLAGASVIPVFVLRVGHIRVYAALAALGSTAALLYVLWVGPWVWGPVRVLTGFAMSGLYVVAESWLNESADNATRGRLLSAYMVVVMGGIALGQLLLMIADPAGIRLFVVASLLVSLAVVPMTLSASVAPAFELVEKLKFRQIWQAAPLGIVGGFGHGISGGALLSLGAVYASRVGMSVSRTAVFMALAIVGAVALQWPIGALSDRIRRRIAILGVTVASGLAALVATRLEPTSLPMLVLIFLVGGLTLPLYSLNLSHINDRVPQRSAVAVSSVYIFVTGLGAVTGPLAAAGTMGALGPNGLFWTIVVVHAAVSAFAVVRIRVRKGVPISRQRRHALTPARAGSLAIQAALKYRRNPRPDRR